MPASVSALEYLELGVSDLDAWHAYSRDVLGAVSDRTDDRVEVRIDDAQWRFRLLPTGEDDVRCAGFSVATEDALNDITTRLRDVGKDVEECSGELAADRCVDRLWATADPDGLRIELCLGERAADSSFLSPKDVSSFVTSDQGLGHMVISVGDLDKANRFYQDCLGFRLSDYIAIGPEFKITFLHCNPRHHTLAYFGFRAPKRLNHIMVQPASLDDVGICLDRASLAGTRITRSLGRHTNDRMLSFYMSTPSGFDIEYGYGGLEIDDATWESTTHDAISIWGHVHGA